MPLTRPIYGSIVLYYVVRRGRNLFIAMLSTFTSLIECYANINYYIRIYTVFYV